MPSRTHVWIYQDLPSLGNGPVWGVGVGVGVVVVVVVVGGGGQSGQFQE